MISQATTAIPRLTPPAIAKELGVAPEKVCQWIKSGELRAFNFATTKNGVKRFAVSRQDLDEFIRSRAYTPITETVRRKRSVRLPDGVKKFV